VCEVGPPFFIYRFSGSSILSTVVTGMPIFTHITSVFHTLVFCLFGILVWGGALFATSVISGSARIAMALYFLDIHVTEQLETKRNVIITTTTRMTQPE
jgi:hypothetical protein